MRRALEQEGQVTHLEKTRRKGRGTARGRGIGTVQPGWLERLKGIHITNTDMREDGGKNKSRVAQGSQG